MASDVHVYGVHERTLDEKGRLVLPAPFRRALQDGAFLVRLDDCIGVWNREQFDAATERVRDSVRMGVAPKNAMRAFFARVAEVGVDTQGRVLVPTDLRSGAGLERDAVVTGQKAHIEIWEPARWRAVTEQVEEQFDFTDVVMDLGVSL